MALSANLNVMIKAARKAGRALVRDFGEVEQLQVSSKGPGDFVSAAPTARPRRSIREDLMEARPSYGCLGEEEGETAGEDPTRRWIVDPLDGTTNFLHGLPHWAVSIALEHKGAGGRGRGPRPGQGRDLLRREGRGRLAQREPAAGLGRGRG